MKAIGTVFETTLNQYFVYRLSFVMWRFRNILNILLVYYLWTSVFAGKRTLFSYTQDQMITYVLLVNIAGAIVLSTRTHEIASDILSGDIMNYLIKPISVQWYITARELADKFLNIVLAGAEICLLLYIFTPRISLDLSTRSVAISLLFLGIGIVLSFLLSLQLSLIAFWTPEVWAPRFIFMVFVGFLSGNLVPLDILPKAMYDALLLTPFPYLIYFSSKALVHGATFPLVKPLIVSVGWCIVLAILVRWTWKKGLKEFSFYGR